MRLINTYIPHIRTIRITEPQKHTIMQALITRDYVSAYILLANIVTCQNFNGFTDFTDEQAVKYIYCHHQIY